MFKSLIKQKLKSNFEPRNYKQDWLLQAREKLSWVTGWVWPSVTINHQIISSITETKTNLLARKNLEVPAPKLTTKKVVLEELLEAFNARNIVKTVKSMNILGLSEAKHSLNWASRSDIWSLSLKLKIEVWKSLKLKKPETEGA